MRIEQPNSILLPERLPWLSSSNPLCSSALPRRITTYPWSDYTRRHASSFTDWHTQILRKSSNFRNFLRTLLYYSLTTDFPQSSWKASNVSYSFIFVPLKCSLGTKWWSNPIGVLVGDDTVGKVRLLLLLQAHPMCWLIARSTDMPDYQTCRTRIPSEWLLEPTISSPWASFLCYPPAERMHTLQSVSLPDQQFLTRIELIFCSLWRVRSEPHSWRQDLQSRNMGYLREPDVRWPSTTIVPSNRYLHNMLLGCQPRELWACEDKGMSRPFAPFHAAISQ